MAPRTNDRIRALQSLKEEAAQCTNCHLYKNATQTVFGDGPPSARIVFVGEQPGDEEDRRGEPFVGPAGRLLDRALVDADIDRGDVYVTNTVKHFKWVPKGRMRLHKKPNRLEIVSCLPWLKSEIDLIQPELVVCLGATAAQALLGPQFRVTRERGTILRSEVHERVMATMHPSSVLRARGNRDDAYEALVADLRVAAQSLNGR
ncbi:MAG: UdgX family uracil-DNA binding protein [Bacteroidota bacterium]